MEKKYTLPGLRLPVKVHCPVCGELLILMPHKGHDALMAQLQYGAQASSKIVCGCGVEGVISLRVTKEGLHIYSMGFWILPRVIQRAGTLSGAESKDWLKRA